MKVVSKNPSKQRKRLYNAPLHKKQKLLAVHLSPELRKKYKKRSLPVRKGDKVVVLVGKFKGKEGKVSNVNLANTYVNVEGLFITKKDGSEAPIKFNPSNLMIKELNIDDEKRFKHIKEA